MKHANEKKRQWILPLILSVILLAGTGALLEVLCGITRYLPLCLCASFCIYTAIINSVLALSGAGKPEDVGNTAGIPAPVGPARADGKGRAGLGKLHGFLKAIGRGIARAARAAAAFVSRRRLAITVIFLIAATAGYQIYYYVMLQRMTALYSFGYYLPALLLVLFILFIAAEKWCKHADAKDERGAALLRNLRMSLALGRLAVLLTLIATIFKLLNLYDAQRWLVIALAVLWYYASVFTVVSLIARLIKKELIGNPRISIPLPFGGGGDRDLGVLSYLEENTGITMRSLWSIKMIRSILPYTVIIAAALLWVSTGLVQIESYQSGAVYRFGSLREQTLGPGLHLTWPWPIDNTVIYDTESLQKMTIGYRSSADTDNTWTGNHGASEYKLLLDGGKELVSINLRLEYKIDNLTAYLRTSSSPERILEAFAYELVTERTIITNLESLLNTNRSNFALSFRDELGGRLKDYNIGLSVVSVVLESIHPPVEVADVYQRIISAGIEGEKYILDAEARAAVKIAEAQASARTALGRADASYYTKIAAARSDVASFMASVEADRAAPEAYRYYKYLKALGTAYGSSRLVIIGKDIDSSNIYIGNAILIQ